MSNFSLNETPVVTQSQEEENKVSEIKPVAVEAPQVQQPKVHLENVDTYKLAIASMREELIKLVQEGHLAEQVAEKLLADFMHNTFNQVIKLRFE